MMAQVLVAEDGAAIGLALEDALTDGGYSVAGTFPSCASAFAWLADHTPDLALLDLMLRDGPCIELARALRRRRVPVLFLSGYDHASLPEDLRDVGWVEKPVSYDRIMQALTSLQNPRPRAEVGMAAWQPFMPRPPAPRARLGALSSGAASLCCGH